MRREKAAARKNKNIHVEKQKQAAENQTIEYTIPVGFSEEVLQEVSLLPTDSTSPNEIVRRRDMRDVLTFTIDPDEAKDFDDALSFQVLDTGNYQIGIHIADVTHYVSEGTALVVMRGSTYILRAFALATVVWILLWRMSEVAMLARRALR